MPSKKIITSRPMINVAHHEKAPTASSNTISLQEQLAREIRDFILHIPTPSDRFAFYRRLETLDPAVLIARNYLMLMAQRSYLGPRLDNSDESYIPTAGFLENVNRLLSEIELSVNIGAIIKDLIRHGNAFLRLHRSELTGKIISVEIIPPDIVTILDEDYLQNQNRKAVIHSADYFVLNEYKSRKDRPYRVITKASDEEESDAEEGEAREIVLSARDVIHVAWDSEGSQIIDSFGRQTYGIWGQSVYDSIIFYVKAKLTLITDYVRWMRTGMPRWFLTLQLDDVMNLDRYPGSMTEKIKAANDEAQKIFHDFENQLYYIDRNEESPTYGKRLPIEPDEIMVLSDKCQFEQKGGAAAPDMAVMDSIKEWNRAIASAMGVPLQLFNYNEGSTYATSKISAKFLASYGGGLIRSLEFAIRKFLQAEFELSGLPSNSEDWENFYIEYDRDDLESQEIANRVEQGKATAISNLANAVRILYDGGIITRNSCLEIMRDGPDGFKALGPVEGGDQLKPLQPALPETLAQAFKPQSAVESFSPIDKIMKKLNLKKDEKLFESQIESAVLDAFQYFIEELSGKLEKAEKTTVE